MLGLIAAAGEKHNEKFVGPLCPTAVF